MHFHHQQRHSLHKPSEKGMTLIEVLIALTVFSVGVIAVAMMLNNALRYSASARFMTEATEIAQFKMERLLNAPYNDPELNQALSPYGPFTIGNYSMTWTIREDVPMTAMKTIKVIVGWQEHGREKKLAVDAIKQ